MIVRIGIFVRIGIVYTPKYIVVLIAYCSISLFEVFVEQVKL